MAYPIAERIQSLPSYPFAVISQQVQTLRDQGLSPIDFGVGDPTIPTPEIVRERLKTAVDERAGSGYPSYIGDVGFREAVAAWSKRRFDVDLDPATEITITVGSKEGIFNFPLGHVNPGDIVICPTPGYPPYARGTSFAGGTPYFLPLTKENGYLPDLDSIPDDIAERARILWLCYPGAPTGVNAPREFFEKTIAWGQKNNVIIVNDEAYVDLYFTDEPPHSILEYGRKGVIAFHSMSKRSAMTGWRIGWTAGDPDIIATFRKVKTNVDSGCPTFLQDAAIAALEDDKHVEEMRADYAAKRKMLQEMFALLGMEDCAPDSSIHYWQKLPAGVDALGFAKKLLAPKIAVVCTPGPWVSDECTDGSNPGEGYVRFSMVPSVQDTERACAAILGNRESLLR
jgi:LL-diaminopimelate aminotransferase